MTEEQEYPVVTHISEEVRKEISDRAKKESKNLLNLAKLNPAILGLDKKDWALGWSEAWAAGASRMDKLAGEMDFLYDIDVADADAVAGMLQETGNENPLGETDRGDGRSEVGNDVQRRASGYPPTPTITDEQRANIRRSLAAKGY